MDVQSMSRMEPVAASRVGLWAVTGTLLYVVGGFAMLFVSLAIADVVLGALGIDSSAGTSGLSIRNATFPVGWGVAVAAASVPIGRRLVPGVRFGVVGWVVLPVGLAIAAVTSFLGIEFVRERMGVYSVRATGFTSFTSPSLVAIALGAWATLALPAGQGRAFIGLTLAAVAALSLSLLPSVDGARDGIDATSVPLVVAFAVGVAYAAAVSVGVIRRLTPSSSAP